MLLVNIVEKELTIRKFISKLPLLLDNNCKDVRAWRSLFPESNNVWRELYFSKGNKIRFKLALSPFWKLLSLFD